MRMSPSMAQVSMCALLKLQLKWLVFAAATSEFIKRLSFDLLMARICWFGWLESSLFASTWPVNSSLVPTTESSSFATSSVCCCCHLALSRPKDETF
ncbi:Os06g0310801 [Oryza sativa Japonica Group]|uniref:Os06g0310801 protein n=1 Tax=Oryza sativa subsp. japonica TaxID=39947 RepID=A0A0P0WW34_ORYSJ|nr:hypothetical protein EE612_033620 [Oryza sativa]BAS97439.1 Os06g0310801 [Oryza sativa Japonica Group]